MHSIKHEPAYGHSPGPSPFPAMSSAYGSCQPSSYAEPRLSLTLPMPVAINNKRPASSHPHPSEPPTKKKQSKWSASEDASIIELRGNGMKWEDISRHLPGRSAISCRLRFQNYLERRAEWDEEKKNKLARLYERFKKDMWEKIAKEMQLPWRAAEAMHWHIGEVEMANRANVPVFHLASSQQAMQTQSNGGPFADSLYRDITPPLTSSISLPRIHAQSLPQLSTIQSRPNLSPEDTRMRRSCDSVSPPNSIVHLRGRADSARSIATTYSTSMGDRRDTRLLPPVGELIGQALMPMHGYTLPPVVTSPEMIRR